VWESDGGTCHARAGCANSFLTILHLPLIHTTATMDSLVQRFDAKSAFKEIERAKAIVEEDGDTASDLMWGVLPRRWNPKIQHPCCPGCGLTALDSGGRACGFND